jgi:hypothetical protein
MTGLESAAGQVDQAIYRSGNRIEALNLGRPQRQIWNEHTRSVQNAANRFRSDVRRVPRSGAPMRFVNGRAVRTPAGQQPSQNARPSTSPRPTAATEAFNQMFRSATGYWTAVDEMMNAAREGGVANALAGQEPFMNLQAQAPRIAENVQMLGMARSVAGAGLGSIDTAALDRRLEEAGNALAALEREFSAPCAQQNAGAGITNPTPTPPAETGGGGGSNAVYYALGAAIGGGLILGTVLKPKEGEGKSCGPKPVFTSFPPSSSQLSAYRSWCQCLGYRTSGTASNGDFTCLN